MMKIRKSKKNLGPGEKPAPIKTQLRNTIVVPEMVGGVVGIHNGKDFANVEIKFDMIGKYLGEFAMSYKPTKHGNPGVGATKGSQHTDKK
jgi:small subunit ribosomal protein S15e